MERATNEAYVSFLVAPVEPSVAEYIVQNGEEEESNCDEYHHYVNHRSLLPGRSPSKTMRIPSATTVASRRCRTRDGAN